MDRFTAEVLKEKQHQLELAARIAELLIACEVSREDAEGALDLAKGFTVLLPAKDLTPSIFREPATVQHRIFDEVLEKYRAEKDARDGGGL